MKFEIRIGIILTPHVTILFTVMIEYYYLTPLLFIVIYSDDISCPPRSFFYPMSRPDCLRSTLVSCGSTTNSTCNMFASCRISRMS